MALPAIKESNGAFFFVGGAPELPALFTTEGKVAQVYKELEGYAPGSLGAQKRAARYLTLADLQALSEKRQADLVKVLGLTEVIAKVNRCFKDGMKEAGPSILSLVPLSHLYDLIEEPARLYRVTPECDKPDESRVVEATTAKKAMPMEKSLVYLALAPDKEIRQMFDSFLAENFKEIPPVLYFRLKNQAVFKRAFDGNCMTVGEVAFLSARNIEQLAPNLPDLVFALLTDEQLKELDFSKLTPGQMAHALRDPLAETPEGISRKFGILSEEQTAIVLAKVDDLPRFLPDALYPKLPLSKMRREQIRAIFPDKPESQFKVADRIHLQMIPAEELAGALRYLSYWQTRLFSEAQVQAIGADKIRNSRNKQES